MRHIGYVHAHDPNFNVVCGIEGCSRSYGNFLSYKRHLYREHRHVFNLEVYESGAGGSADSSNLDQDDIDDDVTATASIESAQASRRKRAAMFVLKTSEVHRLPLAMMESLLPDISTLVEHATLQIQERLLDAISREPSITEQIIRSICQDEDITNPFSGMETTYKHTQYFKDYLNMIVRRACVHTLTYIINQYF